MPIFLTFEAQSFMYNLIDTHCHLYLEDLQPDLDDDEKSN
jgi:hypothetical protein